MNNKIYTLFSVITFSFTLSVNFLANFLPINGLNTGQISALYNNYFVPAGYTFSIWGLIYLFLFGFTVYSSFLILSNNAKKWHVQITKLFVLTNIANAAWIYCWHYLQIQFTIFLMLFLLVTLIRMYIIILPFKPVFKTAEKWLLYIPIVLYMAWISVATIANMAAYLSHLKWTALGIAPIYWSCTMLVVAAALGIYFSIIKKEVVYGFVIFWALLGIKTGQQNISIIKMVASIAAVFVSSTFIYTLIVLLRKQKLETTKKPSTK